MQAAELGTGLQAEFIGQSLVPQAVLGQRVGAAASPVQRVHEDGAHPLAEWVLRHPRQKLSDDAITSLEDEVGLGLHSEKTPFGEALGGALDHRRLYVHEG